MGFAPLHKNTGDDAKSWQIGNLFVHLTEAEQEPKQWSNLNASRTIRTTCLFGVHRLERYVEDGPNVKAVSIILGKYKLSITLVR